MSENTLNKIDINRVLKDLNYVLLAVFTLSIPFSVRLSSWCLILLCLLKFLHIGYNKNLSVLKNTKMILIIMILIFVYYSISVTWNGNSSSAWGLIEKRFAFLAFPFLFLVNPYSFDKDQIAKTLSLFVISIVIACLYTHLMVAIKMDHMNLPLSKWNSWWFTSANLSMFLKIHPSYLTIYINFALIILIYYSIKMKINNRSKLLLIFSSVFYLVVYSLLLASRLNMLLSVGIFLIGITIFTYKKSNSKKVTIIGSILVFSILIVLAAKMPYLKSKFNQTITYFSNIDAGDLNSANSTSSHFNSWKCVISSTDGLTTFLFGSGLGGGTDRLYKCYEENEFNYNLKNNYNAHNEIFQIYLSIGLIGIILFFLLFLNLFIRGGFLMKVFLLVIAVSFIGESILSRQKGIVFFMFFSCILLVYTHNKDRNEQR